jgi:prepilin-type N-terminal cleavage/methylation domain-containing protein
MRFQPLLPIICFHPLREKRAFTLPELMVTMAIFFMFIAGIVYCHLFGVRMFEITKAKLGASDEARQAISLLSSEIRTATNIKIGTGSLGSFTEIALNTPQIGNALQVYATSDTNFYVRYFWDSSDRKLKRTINGAAAINVVAHFITNNMVFTSEDHLGNIITNNQNNRVIGLNMQFFQIQYPVYLIGPGNYFDFYQLRTKITRRAIGS